MIPWFAVSGWAFTVAVWGGLGAFHLWRYIRPSRRRGEYRRPQTLILAGSCAGWVAFLGRAHLREWQATMLEAMGGVGALVAVLAVYVYESRPRRHVPRGP